VALKKYTKNNGMSLKAVRAYTKQLLKLLNKLLIVVMAVTIPGVISTAPSNAFGTKTYTSGQWKKILKQAEGQTVNWYMWGGGAKINTYVNDYIGAEAKKLGVTLNQVKLGATAEAVNKVLGEKQAGKNTDGSVDMIWINGENFATGVQADIWHCDWATKLPSAKYVDWNSPSVSSDFGTPVNGCEAPWATASSGLVYDSTVVPRSAVKTLSGFIDWVKANPGKFTYPAPPDFNGSMTARRLFYHANGGYSDFLGSYDESKFKAGMEKTATLLNSLEPSLWRKGATYPANIGELEKLYANGEISAYFNYGALASFANVKTGLFPESTRVAAFAEGMIGNISYVAVPYNSPNKAGAQVIANILQSPAAQLKMQVDGVIGSPAIVMNRTQLSGKYRSLPIHPSSTSPAKLAKNANPELTAAWLRAIDAGWIKDVQQK
jgi:putative spermidine/putrescine transport system substrate-binding protein